MCNIKYRMDTFPTSEKFRIFRVFNDCIWQIISPKAYNVDTGEVEYFDFIFDDMVTADLVCKFLNEAEKYENKMGKRKNK